MNNEIATREAVTPMALLQAAQEKGASIEQMQQLMDLQERWEANEARKAYNEAMSEFRRQCPTIKRSRKVAHNNTKYAGLAESIEVIKPLMASCGLSHQWKTKQTGTMISVECIVTHRQGHSESTSLETEPDKSGGKNSIQAIGSTVAYLERYTLYAVLGLASREMDDDGNGGPDEETISDEQLGNIEALIDEVKADEKAFCTFYKIDALHHLPARLYNHAAKSLEKKRGE